MYTAHSWSTGWEIGTIKKIVAKKYWVKYGGEDELFNHFLEDEMWGKEKAWVALKQ